MLRERDGLLLAQLREGAQHADAALAAVGHVRRRLGAGGRGLGHAADEYHLLAGRAFPPAEAYEDVEMTEDGVGMARAFESEFHSVEDGTASDLSEEWASTERSSGFFRSMEGAPALGYRAPRTCGVDVTDAVDGDVVAIGMPTVRPRRDGPGGVLVVAPGRELAVQIDRVARRSTAEGFKPRQKSRTL